MSSWEAQVDVQRQTPSEGWSCRTPGLPGALTRFWENCKLFTMCSWLCVFVEFAKKKKKDILTSTVEDHCCLPLICYLSHFPVCGVPLAIIIRGNVGSAKGDEVVIYTWLGCVWLTVSSMHLYYEIVASYSGLGKLLGTPTSDVKTSSPKSTGSDWSQILTEYFQVSPAPPGFSVFVMFLALLINWLWFFFLIPSKNPCCT